MIKIMKYNEVPVSEIFARTEPKVDVEATVRNIIQDVIDKKDQAVREYTLKLDGVDIEDPEVSEAEFAEAMEAVAPGFLEILKKASANIRKFHEKQVRNSFIINDEEGVVMGQKVIPVDRAGVYVPGGTAPLSSTVLMDVIPAKIAGVKEVMVMTPPNKEGKIDPSILAAAKVAGADRVFKVGGAQAIAALAYGTEKIPRADKIVGPGNAYVAEAKRQVYGKVSIDMIAGPSEILIVADGKTDPRYAAADLLSQAEHDRMASAVLVTDSFELAEKVAEEIEKQIRLLDRKDIARASIDDNGKIIVADDIRTAIDIANELAPEHLELCVDDPFSLLNSIRHAGSIFMGRNCPEALGDYMAGPNHTLPTGGTARFSSPLSVDDFVKKSQYTYYTKEALDRIARDIAVFAETEGLTGHARSAVIRTEDN